MSPVSADDRFWVFREADVLPGYPQPLREYGKGVPVHKIDTAIWWEPNGYTYFFSGDRCGILNTYLHLISFKKVFCEQKKSSRK